MLILGYVSFLRDDYVWVLLARLVVIVNEEDSADRSYDAIAGTDSGRYGNCGAPAVSFCAFKDSLKNGVLPISLR